MAVRFDLDSLDGVAVGVADGPLTLDEMKESALAMWRRVEGPDVRILWDLREAHFDLSGAEIRDLADFSKRRAPPVRLRTAFLVDRDHQFGLLRMFQTFSETENARTSVFREEERALAWLAGDAPHEAP